MYKKPQKIICLLVIFCFILLPQSAYALPQGGTITSGSGSIAPPAGDTLNISQTSDRMVATWDSFDILQQETVNFAQPNSAAIALNRVGGVDPSLILGALNANGRVWILNPNGVLFGTASRVDVAGLVASSLSLDMSDTDFVNGTGDTFSFSGPGGSVANYGDILVNAPGGYVALLGSSVKNFGKIANLGIETYVGKVLLAAGEQMTINLDPEGIISAAVDIAQGTDRNDDGEYAAVNNMGEIYAPGGKVVLTAEVLDSVFQNAVNNDGIIEAMSMSEREGQVLLKSNEDIEINGTIRASDAIDAYAEGNIILGKPVEDQTATGYSWKYLSGDRAYKFKEFGYYYDAGGQLIVLAQGDDIGKDSTSPTYGGGVKFLDGDPQGQYTKFDTGKKELMFYEDDYLNSDKDQHIKIKNDTEYWWEDQLNLGDKDFNDAVIDFRAHDRTAYAQPALLDAPDIFLTAKNGYIEQKSGEIKGNNLMLATAQGMFGDVASNGGLSTQVNKLSATNSTSGNIAVENTGTLTIADLSGVTGLNRLGPCEFVTGSDGVYNYAPGGEVNIKVVAPVPQPSPSPSMEGQRAYAVSVAPPVNLYVFAPVDSYGPVTFASDGGIIHDGAGDVTIHQDYIIPPPINLDSPSHDVGVVYDTEPIDRTVDVEWQLGEGEPGYNFTGTAAYGYEMGPGSEIQTNGGNATITAGDDVSLALINAKTGNVNVTSTGGSILDNDGGVAPADYDVIARNIKLNVSSGESVGGPSPDEIDLGFPFDFSYLWDNTAGTTPDTEVGEPYAIGYVSGTGDWSFAAISEELANGSWWFHVRTVENIGNIVRGASDAAHIGPFIFDSEIPPPPPPPEETYWEIIEKELRVYYEILDPSQFLSFEPARYIGLYAYHPITETDDEAFDDIKLDAGAYEFIENNINLNQPLGPYFGGTAQ